MAESQYTPIQETDIEAEVTFHDTVEPLQEQRQQLSPHHSPDHSVTSQL
jgi:hypothetical protein